MATAFVIDSRFAAHTMERHPEYAARLTMIRATLEQHGLLERFTTINAEPVSEEFLHIVHDADYLRLLEKTSRMASPSMLGLDTYITPQSYEIARLAVGGVLQVVDAVLTGETDNGLAAIRPPGHHATPSMGMGFCLLNNIALAARHAQQVHNIERVLIVDYDVHHGNGTQDIFYDDPTVLYISTHQSPLYPGTGAIQETGKGAGKGFTINAALPPGVGDQGYAQVFAEIVLPAARQFEPEVILVSGGYDAHWADPLANMMLSLSGYTHLDRTLLALAHELCEGRIVFILEGGYNLQVLGNAWANVAHVLLGDTEIDDVLGPADRSEPSIAQPLNKLKQIHNLT
ncbi:MAG: histone deacetylase [Anaerolineae bacterium]|nr:histone deacetylase [Anaerolineae bacterium]